MNSAFEPALIPLAVKLGLTLFVMVMAPVYLVTYGPTNFFYFCDVALLLTLAGVWREDPLLISMAAVGIVVMQALWALDLLIALTGHPLTSVTTYMFSPNIPLFIRGLSLYHLWLPALLVWLVWRTGYDARGFAAWTVLAWVLIAIAYIFLPAPPAPAGDPNLPVNVNYVYGLSDKHAQTWMPPLAWLALMALVLPLVFYWPAHRLFVKYAPAARAVDTQAR